MNPLQRSALGLAAFLAASGCRANRPEPAHEARPEVRYYMIADT